jgi:hypothetical protein
MLLDADSSSTWTVTVNDNNVGGIWNPNEVLSFRMVDTTFGLAPVRLKMGVGVNRQSSKSESESSSFATR